MKDLVFVTHTAHKLQEMKEIVGDIFEVKNLSDVKVFEDIPETGSTFEENALQKVEYLHNKIQCNCFADDSGLSVEALNGEPGIYSARYAGEPSDMHRNTAKLLKKMEGITNRKAHFTTVIALILNDTTYVFEGVINGTITESPRGEGGFGYDPIFMPNGYDKTFAELPSEVKNKISHRAIAMQKFTQFIKQLPKDEK